jgi:hypothetical protein
MQYFFSSREEGASDVLLRSVPRALKVACILQDARDEVAVVTFATKGGVDFFIENSGKP